ncbi:cytochrome C [Nitrogeniibacter mangrovi]|uniref:Cytochrome C n=1 Tax=Nitrogeniibacter mangrovi TaxID=2016596 RepID=A0A6C1B5C0_9RHOO|nr:c-type cytochrome [Nitrogeniibacter mangrovi]QID18633.1 cytochrome C [Nitrogeniibacter mangrovi]
MRLTDLLIAAALASASLGSQAQDPDLARDLAATCANCHGTNGHALGDAKKLAGQPQAKLLKKLDEFISGDKPATIMNQIAKGYTREQLELITGYFAAQKTGE